MTRKRLLILALALVAIGGGIAGALFWRGHGAAPGAAPGAALGAAPGAVPAAEAPGLRFVMPLLVVPLWREEAPVAYVPLAPELHLATEADKAAAELRLPHLQDRFVIAAYDGGQGAPTKEGQLDFAALRARLLAAARAELGEGAVRDLSLTETMRQRR